MTILLLVLASAAMATDRQWRFEVYLDDKNIGYHDFTLSEINKQGIDGKKVDDPQAGNQRQLKSEASFEYRLMFVKLFGYEHRNTEIWTGNCLAEIAARTETKGKTFQVNGSLEGDRFLLDGTSGEIELPACNMSFAYWNHAFLQQDQLINSQNGEVLDIEVSEPQLVELEIRGVLQPAWFYQLVAKDMKIDLWYSENNEWLALETDAGDRRLRYLLL
jgi:hypothetical protein